MSNEWAENRTAFVEAAGWFVATTKMVGDRWLEPGLGEWDVRALVGHTSRSLVTVEAYLAKPSAAVEVESAVAYYRAVRHISHGPEVAQRGRDAGAALGDDPVTAVAQLAERVLALVAECDGSELLTTIAGGMRLVDYLPTRVFEFVVHTADLHAALGLPAEPPASPARLAYALAGELAIADGRMAQLLLGITGRERLPAGFTVL